ncbi:MAG: hypothetical protein A2710_11095 [Burkholderiales bacterium RIFCSPHIGHO2_01_FULL_64_960]|jgi:hypothetical protein|nr:MAG: hypothetical protein A2710_11095 [Burkholderiales bacterium RIFCSPHIGHO2_01_FULL_64_960]
MQETMQTLATTVQSVPPGLVLAQPVLDAHAQLLLPAGAPVTSSMLHNLQQRGIQTVSVQADPSGSGASAPGGRKGSIEETQARLHHLFRPALRMEQLNPLLHLILRYRTTQRPGEEP